MATRVLAFLFLNVVLIMGAWDHVCGMAPVAEEVHAVSSAPVPLITRDAQDGMVIVEHVLQSVPTISGRIAGQAACCPLVDVWAVIEMVVIV